jgi:NAD(P)-dependent dehydrogenase (short-subunit alcohol dehydrogenase family)
LKVTRRIKDFGGIGRPMSRHVEEGDGLPPLRFPPALAGMLAGKVAIITGASRGIGAAAAFAFAQAGAKVVLAARDEEALKGVTDRINGTGTVAVSVPTDVTEPGSVEKLVSLTLQKFHRLDAAFNNAGGGHMPAPLAELDVEWFDQALGANARGTFLSMKYEIPAMLRTGGGSIVNMSSTAGLQGVSGIAGYVAGKHAVIGLTKAAAMDYAKQNVRVNAVAPGPILTERTVGVVGPDQAKFAAPVGRIGNREEVAAVAVWFCSDLSSFVTGAVVPVDGGRLGGVSFSRPDVTPAVTPRISGQRAPIEVR